MLVLQDDTVKSGSEEAIAKRLKLNPLKILTRLIFFLLQKKKKKLEAIHTY